MPDCPSPRVTGNRDLFCVLLSRQRRLLRAARASRDGPSPLDLPRVRIGAEACSLPSAGLIGQALDAFARLTFALALRFQFVEQAQHAGALFQATI